MPGIIVSLFITVCGPETCETYVPATFESDDFSALQECDTLAEGMPEELQPVCRAGFAE